MVPCSTQVNDYLLQGPHLDDVCVWDYIAQIDKISKKSLKQKSKKIGKANKEDPTDKEEESEDDIDLSNIKLDLLYLDSTNKQQIAKGILFNSSRERPHINFSP